MFERGTLFMSLQFGVSLPQGWVMDLASIHNPVEAYEAMTRVAQTADELGFQSGWLVDHFHTIPQPSEELSPASSSPGYLSSMQEDAGIPSSFGDVRTDESIG
jgi:hypothetical protein